ncbi:DUF3005 domain-containing protein [Mycetohabitans sp. B5]|uniref:Uncharacterized protein n=1 Tax=Mycetohabitans endofungorum TaxID=417203 RepID=A0A2P5KE99_9BURK|nr:MULTISPECIES: DUF3005 domain-containing protein [Mycetohabitans]MCG1053868.1 DUF3005 domain-containing protein [Mycetohabitans sp. B5]PPB85034.1 Protein of unknown function (DUF3005) [Mycetohabitans endofungorum]
MDSTDKNPPQPEQRRQAAESPLKKPETETARAQVNDIERASSGKEAGLGNMQSTSSPGATSCEPRAGIDDPADPVQAAHPRGTDLLNNDATDNTVDTDGKNAEAKKTGRNIQAIVSQATLDNAVSTPARGLGGFDSRVGGELPLIALRDSYELIDHGVVTPVESPHPAFESTMTDRESLATAAAARGESYAAHRLRPERMIEIRLRSGAKH